MMIPLSWAHVTAVTAPLWPLRTRRGGATGLRRRDDEIGVGVLLLLLLLPPPPPPDAT